MINMFKDKWFWLWALVYIIPAYGVKYLTLDPKYCYQLGIIFGSIFWIKRLQAYNKSC